MDCRPMPGRAHDLEPMQSERCHQQWCKHGGEHDIVDYPNGEERRTQDAKGAYVEKRDEGDGDCSRAHRKSISVDG